jgi:hypothetical protein
MRAEMVCVGPWQVCVKVRNVLCPDGKRRVARTGYPDTAFSMPARVSAYGKTVSGFVTNCGGDNFDIKFVPLSGRKNSYIFDR